MPLDKRLKGPFANPGRRWYEKDFHARQVRGRTTYLKRELVPDEIKEFFPKNNTQCDLAYMVNASITEGPVRVLARKQHHRSFSLGWMSVKGHRRFVDVKGTGQLHSGKRTALRALDLTYRPSAFGARVRGGLERADALKDTQVAEMLLDENASGHQTFALVDLETVLVRDGELVEEVTVREWADRHGLSTAPELVMQFREFTEEHRVSGIDKRTLRSVIQRLQARGHGEVHDRASWSEYCVRELGRCIGVMHRKRVLHGGISLHNVLADGKPTDFDTAVLPYEYERAEGDSEKGAIGLESRVIKDGDEYDEKPDTFGQGVYEDLHLCEMFLDDLSDVLDRCGDTDPDSNTPRLWSIFCKAYDSETAGKGESWSSGYCATSAFP